MFALSSDRALSQFLMARQSLSSTHLTVLADKEEEEEEVCVCVEEVGGDVIDKRSLYRKSDFFHKSIA